MCVAIYMFAFIHSSEDTNTGYQDLHNPEYSIGSRPVDISVDTDEVGR